MKTSLEIDSDKIDILKKLSKSSTLREMVDRALDSYIKELRRQDMLLFVGSDKYEGEYKKIRGKNVRSR